MKKIIEFLSFIFKLFPNLGEKIKKHKIIVLLFIVTIMIAFGAGYLYFPKHNKGLLVQPNIIPEDIKTPQDSKNPESVLCKSGRFEDHLDKWNIKYYNKPDENGFYCPHSRKFLSPDIWYKELIPTNFESLIIRYKMKNKDNNVDIPPPFIFSIGENPRILRFYIAEKNPEIIGFEKIAIEDSGILLKREKIKLLGYPIEYNAETELSVRMMINKGNKVTIYFNLKYISAFHGESVENDFSYEVDLPDPEPDSEHSTLKIGFGTVKGSCIKPISYSFCY